MRKREYMELKELKITKMEGDHLGWQVNIIASVRLGYFTNNKEDNKKVTELLAKEVGEYLRNHWDISMKDEAGKFSKCGLKILPKEKSRK